MNKTELRKVYLQKRKHIRQSGYEDLNQKLLLQFQQINSYEVKVIHMFLPIRQHREPDTLLIRDWLKEHYPQIQISYPKADFNTCILQHFADDENLQLAVNAYGIPEPVSGTAINTASIDLVLVPLLAFDRQGYRVGYGKGFYDRFMAECRPGTRFIGLSFFEPVEQIDDVNAFDQPLHQCITPEKIFF